MNAEHYAILRRGAPEWNAWRAANRDVWPDLSNADCRGFHLRKVNFGRSDPYSAQPRTDLRGADFRKADLDSAYLGGTDLRAARFEDANLRCADLARANALEVSFRSAFLSGANLDGVNLTRADLRDCPLLGATFFHTVTDHTDLRGTRYGGTHFGYEDLSTALIKAKQYYAPSPVSIQTMRLTAAGLTENRANQQIIEAHFKGCGVSNDEIDYFRSLIGRPIEFYSCFLSYGHSDKRFVRRLYDALQNEGIRCWLDEHDLLPGDNLYDQIDRGIKLWDKMLLCCSKAALTSWWVDNEITQAFAKEQELQRDRGEKVLCVIPLDLDGFLFEWTDGKATKLRERVAANFTDRRGRIFNRQIERLVAALRPHNKRRTGPPPSLL